MGKKGDRSLNPTEAWRKREKKREQEKRKLSKQISKSIARARSDPMSIKYNLDKLNKIEKQGGRLSSHQLEQKRKLEHLYNTVTKKHLERQLIQKEIKKEEKKRKKQTSSQQQKEEKTGSIFDSFGSFSSSRYIEQERYLQSSAEQNDEESTQIQYSTDSHPPTEETSFGPPKPSNELSFGPPKPSDELSFGPPKPSNEMSFGPPKPTEEMSFGPPKPSELSFGPSKPSMTEELSFGPQNPTQELNFGPQRPSFNEPSFGPPKPSFTQNEESKPKRKVVLKAPATMIPLALRIKREEAPKKKKTIPKPTVEPTVALPPGKKSDTFGPPKPQTELNFGPQRPSQSEKQSKKDDEYEAFMKTMANLGAFE